MDSKKSASKTTRLEHLSVVSSNEYSARTKHLQLRKWFCTELIESGRISVHHVPTEILPSDIFTKTTTKAVHQKLVDLIQAYASSNIQTRTISGGNVFSQVSFGLNFFRDGIFFTIRRRRDCEIGYEQPGVLTSNTKEPHPRGSSWQKGCQGEMKIEATSAIGHSS